MHVEIAVRLVLHFFINKNYERNKQTACVAEL